jgi:hypothetical protein
MNTKAARRLHTKARTRLAPLLVGLGLLIGTAAISSQVAGQSAARIDATTFSNARIGAARAIENEVEGRLGNAVHKLAVGSEVFQNQLVRTGKASTAKLQFLDETSLGLSPQTQIRLDSFVYDPDKKTGKVVLNVPYGLVRFVTGTMEKRSYAIRTPFLAVGVRGTTFDMLVRRDRVTVLLIEGGVELTVQPRGTYLIERPNMAITIWQDGRVNGPREWTRSVTEFAALPAQRRAAVTPEPARRTAAQPATPAPGGPGGTTAARSGSAMDRLSGDGMAATAPSNSDMRLQGGNTAAGPRGSASGASRAGRSASGTASQGSSQGSSGVSMPVGGPGVTGQFGSGSGSRGSSGASTVQSSGTSVPRRPASSSGSSGSESWRGRVN